MNILTAINKKYLPYFAAMVRSFADNNPGEHTVYIATKEVTEADLEEYRGYFSGRVTFPPRRLLRRYARGGAYRKKVA